MDSSPFLVVPCPTCGAPAGSPCGGPIEVRVYGAHDARSAELSRDPEVVLRWAESEMRAAGKPDWKERLELVRELHRLMAQSHDVRDHDRALRAFQEAMEEAEDG